MKTVLARLKSPVVWAAVIAQICLIVALFNEGIAGEVKVIATSVVEMLTLFGVLNNPTDKGSF